MPILKTPRCTLRPFTKEDAASLLPVFTSKDVMRYSMTGPMDLPDIQNLVGQWCELYESRGFSPFAILHNEQIIGYAGLDIRIVEGVEKIQVTFRLAENFWGKGIATETASAIKDHAFNKLGLSEIIAITDARNTASINTISKIGMTFAKEIIYGGLPLQMYKISK